MSLIDDAYYEGLEQGQNNLAKYVNVIAAKDTEIAELKAQVEGLKTDMQHSRLIEAAQVKESNELKAEIKYWKDRWEAQNKAHDAEFSSIIAQNAENKRLNAEVERLREGIQDAVDWLNNPDDNVDFDELLQSLLSPAPVTEGTTEDDSDVWGICCPECYEESLSFLNEYANGIEGRCNSCGHVFIEPTKNEDHHE